MKFPSVRSTVWGVTVTTLLLCLLLGVADGRRSRRLRHRGRKHSRHVTSNATLLHEAVATNSAESLSRDMASDVLRQKLLQNSARGSGSRGEQGGRGMSRDGPSFPPFPYLSHRNPQSSGPLPLHVEIPLRGDNTSYNVHHHGAGGGGGGGGGGPRDSRRRPDDDLLRQQLRGIHIDSDDSDSGPSPRPSSSSGSMYRPTLSSPQGESDTARREALLLHGKHAIRGSRKAFVVTKKTYLRKEWCKTQPLRQVIREKGCVRTTILNNFCYGQCNSFFIPRSGRKGAKPPAFMSCGYCKPRKVRHIWVTLRCPGRKGMKMKRKKVQYIKKCRCMAQPVQFP